MSDAVRHAIETARAMTSRLGMADTPVDVFAIARGMGIIVIHADLDDGTAGVLVMKHGKIFAGLNRDNSNVKNRFVMAHQIGHVVLGHLKDGDVMVDNRLPFPLP